MEKSNRAANLPENLVVVQMKHRNLKLNRGNTALFRNANDIIGGACGDKLKR